MKKKKVIWLYIGGILLLLAAALVVNVLLRNRTPDAGEQISAYIDGATAIERTGDTAGSALESGIIEHMTYSVLTQSENTVRLSVTAPDMSALLDEMRTECPVADEWAMYLVNKLQSGDFGTVTTELEVELDENGVPSDSYAFSDAMYGGLLAKLEDMLREMRAAE